MKTIVMLIEVNNGHPWYELIERQDSLSRCTMPVQKSPR